MKWRLIIFSFFVLLCYSCHKEYSCESCMPGASGPPGPRGPQNPQAPLITSLNCASGNFSATAVEATPYSAQYSISYAGGNGAAYKADTIASTGVTGLTAILVAGTLTNGNGNLIWHISGTPATAGNAVFVITIGGKSCTATLQIDPTVIVLNGIIRIPIAVEKERNLVVLGSGKVKAWGNNQFGQIGDGTTTDRHTPVEVSVLTNIAAVASGGYHSLALANDGKVWAWGRNDHGQLGDGTLFENHAPKKIDGLSNIISIAAGFDYSLALKNDGTVWAWGANMWGVVGDGTYTDKYHPVQVINLSGIIFIAAGTEHCLALKNDGTVWSWGWNAAGCLGDGSNVAKRSTPAPITALSDIKAIAANGSLHSLVLKNDGTVWTWGDNFYGQLGDGTSIEKSIPQQLASLTNITLIGTGERHSFAVKNDGSLWAWGWNGNGQLGVDYTLSFYEPNPVNVTLLPGVTRIAGGSFHSLVQKVDGNIYTMGSNVYGQLGDGTNVLNRYIPMVVVGL
jgi:alpha-tubulin suppressor-like RCC1 family protein